MLSQFTNYFLLFILLSFYVATIIRFHQYMIKGVKDIPKYKLYVFLTFIYSMIVAPYALFYDIMNVNDLYEEEEKEETDEKDETYYE